jgi:hypothetical protein
MTLALYVVVESGRIVEQSLGTDLKGMTLDALSQKMRSIGGKVYPITPAGWHTCVDQSGIQCGACESVNHPTERMTYGILMKRT